MSGDVARTSTSAAGLQAGPGGTKTPRAGVDVCPTKSLERLYHRRESRSRWRRLLEPPAPFVMNPREPKAFPLGRHNLYIGGAGRAVAGYINLDIAHVPGVDVVADAHELPFREGTFQRIECDAVLEHVRRPEAVMAEMRRVLASGGYLHLVTPFCHPFHEYPKDFRRFTPDGLRELAAGMEIVAEGWRTGPTATVLVFTIEYAKLLFPWHWWRALAHGALGWVLWPLRYLDLWLLRSPRACRLGNHCYLWARAAAVPKRGNRLPEQTNVPHGPGSTSA